MTASSSPLYSGNDTQCFRVSLALEREIIEGRLPPGARLASERSLASRFGVSSKVIFNACALLEQKHLLMRIPRKGVYVRPNCFSSSTLELLLFAMDRVPAHSVFVKKILELLDFPGIDERVNFTVRLANSQSSSTAGNLEREFNKMERDGFPDWGLLLPMGFLRHDVERALRLPFPVIFIGDFVEGDYDDLNYIRVTATSSAVNRAAVAYARQHGYRRLVYLQPEYCHSRLALEYYREFCVLAADYGMETTELLLPGLTEADARGLADETLRDHRELLASSDLVVSSFCHSFASDISFPDLCYLQEMKDPACRQVRCNYHSLFEKVLEIVEHPSSYTGLRTIINVDVEAHVANYQMH